MPELTTAWVTLAVSAKGMEADIRRAINRAENAAKLDVKIDRSALGREGDRAGRDFASRFERSSGGSGGAAGKKVGAAFVGGFAAVLAGGALTSIAQATVDSFRAIMVTGLDFSKTMNSFQGVTRATAQEMAQMQQTARSLGSDTTLAGASASSAALAMTELAKAGFSIDEAMTAARGTLELATAGQLDAAQAAEIQANAINAFGLSARDAAHVSDLLANAAIASSADVSDIGMSLAQVGGIAKGFGVSIDDTVAALGMLANAGIKGSDAGTLLKTTMQSITDQGNPAQGAIESLGLSLYKLNAAGDKQFVGFRELFVQLDEAKRRMTSQDFQADANILFGSDAMRAAMLGNGEAFDAMFKDLQRVGAGAELANAQMQGLPGAVESFKNTVESIQLDVFAAIGPALGQSLGEFVTWLSDHKTEAIDFFVNVADAALTMSEGVISSVGAMAGILRPLASLLGMDDTAKSLQFVYDASQEAFGALERGRTTMHQFSDRMKEASAFTDALGKSVTTLKVIGNDVTIDVKENTPEVQEKLRILGAHLEQMANDPTRMKIVSDTADADHQINAFRQQQQGAPVAIPFTVHYDQAQSLLPEWFKYIGGTAPMNVAVNGGGLPGPPAAPSVVPTLGGQPFPGRRATGGPVFGAGSSTSDSIPAMLSNGEHVWTAEEVRKAGGQGAMYRMRAMVRGFDSGGGVGPWNADTDMSHVLFPGAGGQYPANAILDTSRTSVSGPLKFWEPDKSDFLFGDIAKHGVGGGKIGKGIPFRKNRFDPQGGGIRSSDMWGPGFAGGGEVGLPSGPGTYVVQPDNVMTALQFAQSVSGSQYAYGSAGPELFDCSGFMSAIYGIVTGQSMPAGQRYFTTESDFSKLGFLPGYDPSSPFNIGVHNGGGGQNSHMAGSVMGYNVESGGSAGFTQIGGSAAGPTDPQFENQYHLPGSMSSMYGMSGANGGSYEVDQQAVFDAETSAIRARNDLVVQRKQLAELEAKGTATESQLLAARNDVTVQERDVQSSESKLAEAKQGKFKKGTQGSSSSGGMDGSSLGQSIFGGILQSIGLDGSLFSNPFEWPNVKSLMAGLNFGGGLLKSAMGGGEETGSTTALAGGGGMIPGLSSISDFLKPIGPQALTPNQPGTAASGIGSGPAPGPVSYTMNGVDPKAGFQKADAHMNQTYRRSGLPAVRP